MGFLSAELAHSIDGLSTGCGSFKVEQEINQGWRMSLTFANKPAITFADDDIITLNFAHNQEPPGSRNTPAMLARVRSKYFTLSGGWNGAFELIDLQSYKLSTGTLSFPTFTGPASDIVSAIAAACDVEILHPPDFTVWKEDIKQSDGWGPLRRIAMVAGMQLIVNDDGKIDFVDADFLAAGPGMSIIDQGKISYNALDRYGKLFVAKNLGQGSAMPEQYYDFHEPGYMVDQPLATPLTSATPYDMSSNGYLGWVGFWDADDKLIAIHPMGGGTADGYTVPTDGSWPAVKFSVWVYPQTLPVVATNCRLRILGVPPITFPGDIDPAIAVTLGSGRGFPQPFQENLIPSLTYANAHYLKWLKEINRGTYTADIGGTFTCAPFLLNYQEFDDVAGRIEKLSWASGIKDHPGTMATVEVEPDPP